MPAKLAIIEQIGERGLLLPEFIARGLAANDRLKYYLALLQAAQARAQAPQQPAANLRVQREASGVADARWIASSIEQRSRKRHDVHSRRAALIIDRLFESCGACSRCSSGRPARPTLGERAALYSRRIEELDASVPCCPDDLVTDGTINGLTSLSRTATTPCIS